MCSSAAGCASDDFINLYFTGSVADLSTLTSQASGLSGDPSASPSEFEFLRNFADGSQTDLQGTLATPTVANPVPEPSETAMMSLLLFAGIGVKNIAAARPKKDASATKDSTSKFLNSKSSKG